jgi:predicted transposase YbfD/YdcC
VTEWDKGHGRVEVRTLTACDAAGVEWPGSQQVCKIDRLICETASNEVTLETVYAVTNLTAKQASPKALLALNRGHWSIENSLHYVRDVTLREDASRVRKGNGSQVMATFRNTVISLLRQTGTRKIASGVRDLATNVSGALALVGIVWLSH